MSLIYRKLFVSLVIMLFSITILACGGGNTSTNNTSTSNASDSPAANTSNQEQSSDSGANFYDSKQLTIIVPYSPGGGYDTYARLVAPHLTKYLPGGASHCTEYAGRRKYCGYQPYLFG